MNDERTIQTVGDKVLITIDFEHGGVLTYEIEIDSTNALLVSGNYVSSRGLSEGDPLQIQPVDMNTVRILI